MTRCRCPICTGGHLPADCPVTEADASFAAHVAYLTRHHVHVPAEAHLPTEPYPLPDAVTRHRPKDR